MIKRSLTLLLAACIFTSAANADWNNPRPLWGQGILNGTQSFYAAGDSRILDLDVDYAVFAPDTFTGSLSTAFSSGFDREGGYIYAYQVYINEPPSSTPFSELQIGLPAGVSETICGLGYDRDYDPSSNDIASSFAYALPDSVSFLFESPQLQPGEFSVTLLFCSALPPTLFAATVYDSGLSDQQLLPTPSPVPVPGAALLGALGLVGVSRIRRLYG